MPDDKNSPPRPTISNLTDESEAGHIVAGSHVGAVSRQTARAIIREVGAALGKPSPSITDLTEIDETAIVAGSHVGALSPVTVRVLIDDAKKSIEEDRAGEKKPD